MKTLHEYLTENHDRNVIDHALRASVSADGTVTFYIHPANVSGDTLDFELDSVIVDNPDGGDPVDLEVIQPDPRVTRAG